MPTFSRSLEQSLHRALALANQRHHECATLEHLLLALVGDQDAATLMRACNVDIEKLRRGLETYVQSELGELVTDGSEDSKPTAGFQRVIQRAVIHVQSSGRDEVTGANVLVAIFAERESPAAYFLQEQGMMRSDAVSYGIAKRTGLTERPPPVERQIGERRIGESAIMQDITIEIRRARSSDAEPLAATHDLAWRTAYQGIIPGPELDKLINRRGAEWWEGAIRKGSRIWILVFGDTVAGYTNYGRNRARSLPYTWEIYELYLRPEFQRRGFGRRLFEAARRDLTGSGVDSLIVWTLSDNAPAVAFFRALGGRQVARSSEKFGDTSLDKIAYAWPP
jgi:ribosomal protein S18 acetylase RimI-like enzyme